MVAFNEIFQDKVKFLGIKPMSLQEIAEALQASYLHQFEVNESRVETIGKSLVKDMQLWQMPRMVWVESTNQWVLGGGRHRMNAILQLVNSRGINAAGKLVTLDDDGVDLEIDEIEPIINVEQFSVASVKELVQFLQTDNGSRTMTTAETQEGKTQAGTLTPAEQLKLKLAKALQAAFAGKSYTFTQVNKDKTQAEVALTLNRAETFRNLAIKLYTAIGTKAKYLAGDNFDVLAQAVEAHLSENSLDFSSNFAREGYKELVESFSVLPYDGVILNGEGEEMEDPTWLDWFRTTIKTPTKKTKASETADKLAKLQAKLAAMGISIDDE